MYSKIAFYARISKADKRNNSISNSINSQISILYDAVSVLIPEYRNNTDIEIYTDDGYSGRSSRRPAFRKMLANALLGRINIIIVKDFSRFSREHILISEFLVQVFPENGIRFISVTDHYDSTQNNTGLVFSFKSLFNEYYCKDISQKVKNALSAKKEAGGYCTANVPFGYSKIPGGDGGMVIINNKEALIVHKIFTLAAEGFNCREIAEILNKGNYSAGRKSSAWEASYIWSVINNPFYTGMHIWHKYESGKRLPKECWRMENGKHSAIISHELYNKARQNTVKSTKKGKRHIFHGITRCKTCHKALCAGRRQKDFLCCNHCWPGEIKKIQTDMLFKICLEKINNELLKHSCPFKEWENLFNSLDGNPFYKELLLNNFIKKIEIGDSHDIDIYWNFN